MATAQTAKKVNVVPVDATQGANPLRQLVYADPKVGKTTLGLTYPRPLIINTDFGLEGDAMEQLQDKKGIQLLSDDLGWGYKDMEGLYFWCRDHADDYDTLFIDSGDQLIDILLREVVREGKGGRSGSNSGALGQTFFDVVPEQAEYLANQMQMATLLTDLRKLGKHMVISFGVREGAGTQGRASFNTSPGLQKPLQHWSSVYGRLLIAPGDSEPGTTDPYRKGDRVLLLDAGSKTSMAGTRYSVLAPHVTNPTFEKMWGLVNQPRSS